jgi:hypothetical protein
MNRGQLILFACAACVVYLRAGKVGRSPLFWAALFVIGTFGCGYGSGFLIGAGSRIFTPHADIEEQVVPFARVVGWSLMIGVGVLVMWLAGRPRTAPSEQQPTVLD